MMRTYLLLLFFFIGIFPLMAQSQLDNLNLLVKKTDESCVYLTRVSTSETQNFFPENGKSEILISYQLREESNNGLELSIIQMSAQFISEGNGRYKIMENYSGGRYFSRDFTGEKEYTYTNGKGEKVTESMVAEWKESIREASPGSEFYFIGYTNDTTLIAVQAFNHIKEYIHKNSVPQKETAIHEELNNLLETRNYFKLRQKFNNIRENLSIIQELYYNAYIEHLFGDARVSNGHIEQLFSKYQDKLADSIRLKLLDLEADNYIRMYQYENAEVIYRKILNEYKSELDSAELENYLNVQALWGTLKEIKPQKIHRKAATINAQRNMFGYVMTPVQSGGINQEFIFDTGANLSTITETTAQNMKLTMYESEIEVGSSTNLSVQTKLAVADSLYIGDLLFENVVFIVVPDGHMVIPVLDYEITGVIGLPVIQQMEEFHIEKDGTILIPEHIQDRNLHNLCLYGLSAIVQMTTSNDTLLFNLDTGARNTELSNLYYQKHKESVEKEGVLTKRQRAGVGGMVEVEEYHLKDFPYTIGSHNNILPDIKVSLSEYIFYIGLHGNLGEDVFTQFDKMILNFHYKYIDFE